MIPAYYEIKWCVPDVPGTKPYCLLFQSRPVLTTPQTLRVPCDGLTLCVEWSWKTTNAKSSNESVLVAS